MRLPLEFLDELKNAKNLLAFSSGTDSTALYFLLKEYEISFDIAIVDYGTRRQSKLEVSRAKSLCFWDNKKCYTLTTKPIAKNFEAEARKIRYDFFYTLTLQESYQNLILAHQLNDNFEWFLMQFCKGSSIENMQIPKKSLFWEESQRKCHILRPMISISKNQIKSYLQKRNIFYFEDSSNLDIAFTRNYFRQNFANPLIENFTKGIHFSLENLAKQMPLDNLKDLGGYFIFKSSPLDLYKIDKAIKKLGYCLSQAQKKECQLKLTQDCFSIVFGGKIALEKSQNNLFIFPYTSCTLTKTQKELFRKHKIPKKFRFFMAKNSLALSIIPQ